LVDVPIEMHDERLTTATADRSMLNAGMNAIERRKVVDKVAADPLEAAFDYYDDRFAKLSASSLRFAVRASRSGLVERLKPKFEALEKLYLKEMMKTRDAVEGLNAFLEKRSAKWENK